VTALADHLPIRAVADYAGHKSIRTTLDNYIGRSAISADFRTGGWGNPDAACHPVDLG
jgi:hypothetical protein